MILSLGDYACLAPNRRGEIDEWLSANNLLGTGIISILEIKPTHSGEKVMVLRWRKDRDGNFLGRDVSDRTEKACLICEYPFPFEIGPNYLPIGRI